jgi:biotin carboxyl carrier protein
VGLQSLRACPAAIATALVWGATAACGVAQATTGTGPAHTAGIRPARSAGVGGARAPSAPLAGGSEYGVIATPQRPVVGALEVPATAPAGRPPRTRLRIEERGVGTVNVRVTITDLSTRRPVLVVRMGWVRTGRTATVRWPAGARLRPGNYHISLVVHDHHSDTLLRRAHASGVATLTVTAPPPPVPPVAPEPGVPTPAQLAADGAIFPVAGPHNFGNAENRFGAPRNGYFHQGQDILTAEGTLVVAPLAGTILAASYQAGGAGYYAVEHTGVGFDFMFAHCKAGSLAVTVGQAVTAAQTLCLAGQTGDATGPHLHFEMWVGGWQAASGHPIDPLAYLEALEHPASAQAAGRPGQPVASIAAAR